MTMDSNESQELWLTTTDTRTSEGSLLLQRRNVMMTMSPDKHQSIGRLPCLRVDMDRVSSQAWRASTQGQ